MDLKLEGRVALVTAASRGLGRACAALLAKEGALVAATARDADAEGLRSLVEETADAKGEVLPLALDLSDGGSIDAVVAAAREHWGRPVEILVGNTPGPPAGPVAEITDDQWHDALEIHVVGMARLVRAVLPGMRERGGGRIVFVATTGVRAVQPNMVLSNATRLALVGIAKTLSIEAAEDGIVVNVVGPGPFDTERMDEVIEFTAKHEKIDRDAAERVWLDEVPLGRMGRPEELASLVALLVSEACGYVTGTVIPIDGGKARAY